MIKIDFEKEDDNIRHIIDNDGRGPSRSSGIFYFLKPIIPRRLQISLRRIRANWTVGSSQSGIETILCKPIKEYVLSSGREFPFIWFWPKDYDMACVVTHDVESGYGFQRVIKLAEIDERCGFRSAFNFVCEKYPIDEGVINELKDRNFEIGIHGVKHDGKKFSSDRVFKERLKIMEHYARRWNAVGFRSPSLLRKTSIMRSLPFEWDSSFPDWDPYGSQPGGCRTVFPFFLSSKTVELPVTMMQDHTLFEIVGKIDSAQWENKLAYISRLGGLVNLIVHPDYIFEGGRLTIYQRFLEYVLSHNKPWCAKPCEISKWWKERNESNIMDVDGSLVVQGPAAMRGTVAVWSQIAENWAHALAH